MCAVFFFFECRHLQQNTLYMGRILKSKCLQFFLFNWYSNRISYLHGIFWEKLPSVRIPEGNVWCHIKAWRWMRESSRDPLNNHSYASMIVGAQLVWGVLFSVRVSINISVGPHSDSSSPSRKE